MAGSHEQCSDQRRTDLPKISHSQLIYVPEGHGAHLGSGGFGDVYRAKHTEWGVLVAVKIIPSQAAIKAKSKTALELEAEKLSSLRHPNIIQILGIMLETHRQAIIMEYMQFGALDEFLDDHTVSWEMKTSFVHDIVAGMNFLHTRSPTIIHRDLKAPNVLIGSGLCAKIADFGLSEWRSYSENVSKEARKGTITHIPPEVWENVTCKPAFSFDVYAFGILLWEMITQKQPFKGISKDVIMLGVRDGQHPSVDDIPADTPRILIQLMEESWVKEPEKRPTFKVILQNLQDDPFWKGIDMEKQIATLMTEISSKKQCEDLEDIDQAVGQVHLGPHARSEPQRQENIPIFHSVHAQSVGATPLEAEASVDVGEPIHREIYPLPPQQEQSSGSQVSLPSLSGQPGTQLRGVAPVESLTYSAPAHVLQPDVPREPDLHIEGTDPAESLRHPQSFSANTPSGSFVSLERPHPSGQDRRTFRHSTLETDSDEPSHARPPPDVEHDAVPSLSSPVSPTVELPRTTETIQGDTRPQTQGPHSGTYSLPPPYSDFQTYDAHTPMNVRIGNAQPVLVHEKGNAKTTIYNTGSQQGSDKGFIQIGDGNYMVVNPPRPHAQPRARSRPPGGKQPTKSKEMISDDDVNKIAKDLGNHWKALGYKFEFSPGELESLKHDHYLDGLQEIIRQMLWKWKRKLGKRATRAIVAQHLWDIEKYHLALKL